MLLILFLEEQQHNSKQHNFSMRDIFCLDLEVLPNR